MSSIWIELLYIQHIRSQVLVSSPGHQRPPGDRLWQTLTFSRNPNVEPSSYTP